MKEIARRVGRGRRPVAARVPGNFPDDVPLRLGFKSFVGRRRAPGKRKGLRLVGEPGIRAGQPRQEGRRPALKVRVVLHKGKDQGPLVLEHVESRGQERQVVDVIDEDQVLGPVGEPGPKPVFGFDHVAFDHPVPSGLGGDAAVDAGEAPQ